MKPKMKPKSTSKISPANLNNSAGKIPAKSPKLRKSQRKAEKVCQVYSMKLRSRIIKGNVCYFRKKNTKRHPSKTGGKDKEQLPVLTACQQQPLLEKPFVEHALTINIPETQLQNRTLQVPTIAETSPITEHYASLSTYNDRFITFAFEGEHGEIYVEDLGENQEKDKVLLRYYDSQIPSNESGDDVDGKKWMVNLSPTKNTKLWLHANKEESSVELLRCENLMPDQAFFLLQWESSEHVSFECKSNPGVFIGVKNNQLQLIQVEGHPEDSSKENIMFKIFQT
ncbi:interleukin-33 [Choloepus didactylus]|uniref:interleukin-33 n=1 Tax=Choloepus didactylus TaxID=27675 RepID=UPI00189F0148|nr:interleukin-33 [Choloepus didactylus]XP_037653697.1 interleukin-33 [Choloepus didactylus]XP_037653698.1 interleukin-33 [Choloepus didactylus]XP_037653699.1 interleukin-33 [Choloepus didactylus]XP_037653700.1 interleukin-33 [Choloepus didactylus]XP_037653701.1 interleukin-33 [Choloepus didactylus]XP_037653702.1 interleukin-33 [Choloepus didactylus]